MNHLDRQQRLISNNLFISCVVPVYNEETVIDSFLAQLHTQLSQLSNNFEIIVVDDGSRDRTAAKLVELLPRHPLKLITLSRNFGKEIALSAGLDHCKGEVVILIDSDFQHPFELIPVFLHQWSEGFDMVYGIRTNRDDESPIKRYFAHVFYALMAKSTHIDIPRNAGDFRLLDRKVVDALNTIEERNRFMKGLYAWVGFKSIGVPFEVKERAGGKSAWKFTRLTELAITGILSFSDLPLRIWSLIGFIISMISFSYALFIILDTMIYGKDIPGFASLFVSIMFFGGVQLLSIGILGEYIARIFNEVKRRPKYIIEEKHGFDK